MQTMQSEQSTNRPLGSFHAEQLRRHKLQRSKWAFVSFLQLY